MNHTIICLGRFGDILNAMPIAWSLSKPSQYKGKTRWDNQQPVQWVASNPFTQILHGCSYITPKTWSKEYNTLPEVINYCTKRKEQFGNVIVAQWFTHTDQRMETESFAKEAWRIAGKLDEFGEHPLVLDRRDGERESRLVQRHEIDRQTVLVTGTGVSSPLDVNPIIEALKSRGVRVLNTDEIHAEVVYDLCGAIDTAGCLVSIDTMHLHLARACKTPVIALLNNEWRGSIPPPQTFCSFRYSEVDAEQVADKVVEVLKRRPGKIIVCADTHGQTERHLAARRSWPKRGVYKSEWGRDARDIGDRPLPYMKDMLRAGLDKSKSDNDVIVWTNSDTGFANGALDKIAQHCAVFEFTSCHRHYGHFGREMFAFRVGFLREHFESLPDVIVAAPDCDTAMIQYLRNLHHIKTTNENLASEFFPVEMPVGLVQHEDHESSWADRSPAAKHNRKYLEEHIRTPRD